MVECFLATEFYRNDWWETENKENNKVEKSRK